MRAPPNFLGAVLLLSLCILLSGQVISQPTSSPSNTSPNRFSVNHKQKGLLVPYHGIISAVDKNAKTFTIEGKRKSHVLKIIEDTSITKGGQTVTIGDIANNDE